jgi:predicted nucleic acid-binding protein
LDTSAILTVLNREVGLDIVLSLLDKPSERDDIIHVPFIALMELEYLLLRKLSLEETMAILALVRSWPVQVNESTEDWRHQAAMVKATSTLSVADAWIASLALLYEADLVQKDPEFEGVPDLSMVKLPFKV